MTTVNTAAPILGGGTGPTVNLTLDFETNPATLQTLGIANVGTSHKVPRADHVHPAPVSSAGYVYATPAAASGSTNLRQLVSTDIPNLDASKITSGTFSTSVLPVETNAATFQSDTAIAAAGYLVKLPMPHVPFSFRRGKFGTGNHQTV